MQGWCLIIMKTLNSYNILCKLCPIRIDPPPKKKTTSDNGKSSCN